MFSLDRNAWKPSQYNKHFNINETTKEIYVKWFTDISGLLNIAIIIENTVAGREYRATVESNEDEAYIAVCNPTDSFSVTVVAFDNCQTLAQMQPLLMERLLILQLNPAPLRR